MTANAYPNARSMESTQAQKATEKLPAVGAMRQNRKLHATGRGS